MGHTVAMSKHKVTPDQPLRDLLRVPIDESVSPADFAPSAKTGFPGKGKKDAPAQLEAMATELSDLQERLFAAGRDNPDAARVLLVLQGLDTSGKGGIIRHAVSLVDPQGLQIKSFKAPTAEERRHNYLWRIKKALPGAGMIGIFDRSHYEDVLVVRVDKLAPKSVWSKRFDEINRFEAKLAQRGTRIIKCMLNVSRSEQQARLLERLEDPEKYWKYNPGDVDTRLKWDAYEKAYADVLTRCNTDIAPWYVIPADRKWYRNWAVARLLLEHLRELDLQWPAADFDVAKEKQRVLDS